MATDQLVNVSTNQPTNQPFAGSYMHLLFPLIIRQELQAFLAEWRGGDQLENAERLRLELEARLVLRMLFFVFVVMENMPV